MKKLFTLFLLLTLSTTLYAQSTSGTPQIDPLDNYIDPATQLDYKTVQNTLNEDQKKVLIERCMMFTIQNEMGQTGEDSMTPAEIDSYEKLVASKCECLRDGHTWKKDTITKGSCDKTTEQEKDLFLYTMDQCVDHLKVSDSNCKSSFTDTCMADFRYQCYTFMTRPHEFYEESNPVLNSCNFKDQTKTIELSCRSYCYVRAECDVKNEEFVNRKIGNIYLLKKKSRSSCVKGSTFGLKDDNTIWVDNSCDADFGIQYKDPQCGYRPICTPRPQKLDYIPQGGVQTITMACNGEQKDDGSKEFCKIIPRVEKNGKPLDEEDGQKRVSYVQKVDFVQKKGAAKCNPGGNGSPKDWGSMDKGLDGGWGIWANNLCNAQFKVTYKWERRLCTMAGKEAASKDTCCDGLVWDPKSKVCNSPPFSPPSLEDESALKLAGPQCKKGLADEGVALSKMYLEELGIFERLFTYLDGKADAMAKIAEEEATGLTEPQRATYNSIKQLHNSLVTFRKEYLEAKKGFDDTTNGLQSQMKEFQEFLALKADNKATIEIEEQYKDNMFFGSTMQDSAHKLQDLSNIAQQAYATSLIQISDKLQYALEEAVQIGTNLVWYCAHNENCSERNWLVKDPKGEKIIDFFHDPIHSYSIDGPRSTALPKLAGVSKYLMSKNSYEAFEKVLKDFDKYQVIYNYNEAKENNLNEKPEEKSSRLLKLFRQYSAELPLRKDSMFAKDEALKNYTEANVKSSNSSTSALAMGIPYYCDKQDDYDVRVPLGKVVEPLRMVQVVKFIKKYYATNLEIYKDQSSCMVNPKFESALDYGYVPTKVISGNTELATQQVKLVGSTGENKGFAISSIGNKFLNLSPGAAITTFGKTLRDTLKNKGKSIGKSSFGSAQTSSKFAIRRKQNATKLNNLIKKRMKYKKDDLLKKHLDSQEKAYGSQLKDKARIFASLAPSQATSGSSLNLNNDKGTKGTKKDTSYDLDKYGSANYDNYGSGTNSYGSRSGSRRSRGGSNGNSSYSSGSGSNNSGLSQSDQDRILDHVDDKKYNAQEEDSLFDIVTKRYIKSAYPKFLNKRKSKDLID